MTTEQEARAERRKKMLQFWQGLIGSEAIFHLFESRQVDGVIEAVDPKRGHIVVRNLATPVGTYASAILRMTDCIAIRVVNKESVAKKF